MVDLQQIHAMDAAGLGLLVELHCRARQRACILTIANPSPCVLQVAGSATAQVAQSNDDECQRCAMTA